MDVGIDSSASVVLGVFDQLRVEVARPNGEAREVVIDLGTGQTVRDDEIQLLPFDVPFDVPDDAPPVRVRAFGIRADGSQEELAVTN